MVESMKIFYFSSILILGFIIIHTQGQDQITTYGITKDPTSVITTEESSSSATLETTTTILSTTIITDTTAITTPPSVYARPIPPLNPTWIIIGGFAGGLTALGLLGIIAGVYTCYGNSRRRVESESEISTDQDNIPLYTVSSF